MEQLVDHEFSLLLIFAIQLPEIFWIENVTNINFGC